MKNKFKGLELTVKQLKLINGSAVDSPSGHVLYCLNQGKQYEPSCSTPCTPCCTGDYPDPWGDMV